jgi:hypothetical protein
MVSEPPFAIGWHTILTVLDWLERAQQRLEGGVDKAGDLSLSPADVELLLELAREAAHASGDRTNAPLVSYLVGVAHGRAPTSSLSEVVAMALGGERPQS